MTTTDIIVSSVIVLIGYFATRRGWLAGVPIATGSIIADIRTLPFSKWTWKRHALGLPMGFAIYWLFWEYSDINGYWSAVASFFVSCVIGALVEWIQDHISDRNPFESFKDALVVDYTALLGIILAIVIL